jgi:hypothetical protein
MESAICGKLGAFPSGGLQLAFLGQEGVGATARRAPNCPVPFHRSLPDERLFGEGIRAVWAAASVGYDA